MKKAKKTTKAKKEPVKKEAPVEVPAEQPSEKKTAKAVARYLRISPRKMRLVINEIRFKPTAKAFPILMSLNKKAARLTEKVLKSAVANAKDLGLEEGKLVVSDIRADVAPLMKRFRPRSMGRADRILKRTTHLSLVLKEGNKDWLGKSVEVVEEEEKGKKGRSKTKAAGSKKKLAGAKA